MISILPEDIQTKFDSILSITRDEIKHSDPILPKAFIGSGSSVAVIATPFADDEQKDIAVDALTKVCQELNADLLIYALESWVLKLDFDSMPAEEVEEYKSGRKKPSQHIERKECVIFQVETRTNAWLGQSEITKVNGVRTLGDVKWFTGAQSYGRFTRILNKLRIVQ